MVVLLGLRNWEMTSGKCSFSHDNGLADFLQASDLVELSAGKLESSSSLLRDGIKLFGRDELLSLGIRAFSEKRCDTLLMIDDVATCHKSVTQGAHVLASLPLLYRITE